MNATRREALALLATMAATAGLAEWSRPSRGRDAGGQAPQLEAMVPVHFGAWQVDKAAAVFVRATDRQGRAGQLYDQLLERTYVNAAGQRVMLSVAYVAGQRADMQLHRPEVCYRAGGFRIGERRAAEVATTTGALPVTQLRADLPERPEPITYWLVSGGRRGPTGPTRWVDRFGLGDQPLGADGVLVRVSSIDDDDERAYALQTQFAAELIRALAPADRQRLTGLAAAG